MNAKNKSASPLTVVFDFGGVLSAGTDPYPAIHDLLGGDMDEGERAYWQFRDALDISNNVDSYWVEVALAAGVPEPGAEQIELFSATDFEYWATLHPSSRELVHDLARSQTRIGLLSNAPSQFGAVVRGSDWFEAVAFDIFSGDYDLAKPDPEIFHALLDTVSNFTGGVSKPENIVYFDDREPNVAAARKFKIDAHHWPPNGADGENDGNQGCDVARAALRARGIEL